ncbi:MAG: arabinogalactan endo-1,4-beta-galactosidase [Verrucomicrobia bacterium]|nr:arabinogalactan endo-1,4-beta-galactosidase [Verrucomicrobiota bacterium]
MRWKPTICSLAGLLLAAAAAAQEFLAGADLSHLAFFEDRGIVYRADGQTQDAVTILKNRGINCVRLRLYTSSAAQAQADPYNYANNLAYTLPLAVRVKNAGLKLMLDFHFSDTWADPGHQTKPAAWMNLSFVQLPPQLRSYCSNTIASLRDAGALPDYAQIGNETTSGLLWTDGQVGGAYENVTQWSQFGALIKAAIQGVKDAAGATPPKFIIHLDRGGDWATTQWFFDHLNAQAVSYDMIGQSYYPFWHGSLDDLRNCLTNAVQRYNKPVIVAETDFPYSNSTNLLGFTASTNGQVDYLVALAQVVRGLPGRKGAGIFWWAAEYQALSGYNLAGFHRRSLFGPDGNVLPAATALGQLAAPTILSFTRNDGDIRLEWPFSGAGMSLVAATNLSPPSIWQTVPDSIQSTGGAFNVTLPVDSGSPRFYRLQSN